MAGYTLSALEADIRNYTEVDSTVFTGALLTRFIENAEHRINLDITYGLRQTRMGRNSCYRC